MHPWRPRGISTDPADRPWIYEDDVDRNTHLLLFSQFESREAVSRHMQGLHTSCWQCLLKSSFSSRGLSQCASRILFALKREMMPEIVGECIVLFLFVCFVLVRPRPQSHSVLFTEMRNNRAIYTRKNKTRLT